MLSIHLRLGLPSGLFPSGFPTNNLYRFLFSHSCHMSRPPHPPRLYNSNYTWRRVQIMKLLVKPSSYVLFKTAFQGLDSISVFRWSRTADRRRQNPIFATLCFKQKTGDIIYNSNGYVSLQFCHKILNCDGFTPYTSRIINCCEGK
jgi:hypothetical protein